MKGQMKSVSRRTVLRGLVQGAAVSVALPLLDCFLDGHGTAMASGAPIPMRFGTWFWGLGMSKEIFVPRKLGADYDLPEEIAALQPVRQHVNVLSNYSIFQDDVPNFCHHTGWVALRSGSVPGSASDYPGRTLDVDIAAHIGKNTRFPLLTANAVGSDRQTVSYEGQNAFNPPEWSPAAFYQRLFGADFADPNAPQFVPNPRIIAQKSVISGVLDEAKKLNRSLGAADRARLDQYFTGLRELELQLGVQLEKPEPRAACKRPVPPAEEPPIGLESGLVSKRHRLLTDLMVMAVACDQTRVFNMMYSEFFAATTKQGYEKGHHVVTHEEPIDPALGYQPISSWFIRRAMEEWAYFVGAFAAVREGDGTLLDRMLIFSCSDSALAKLHTIVGIPMFTAGRAGGAVKTGLHVDGGGAAGTQMGYTAMRVMGLDLPNWGTKSNRTSSVIGEILA